MFASAGSIKTKMIPPPRGLATFRVYLSITGCVPGIYQEAVMGAYRQGNGCETMVVIRGDGERLHAYKLNRKAGYAQIIGDLSETLRCAFEKVAPGENFYMHSECLKKLNRDEIVAAVFAMPVWYGGYSADPGNNEVLRVPFSAKMFRRPPVTATTNSVEVMPQQLRVAHTYNPDLFQDFNQDCGDDSNEEMGMR